jgi:hypothetical protein
VLAGEQANPCCTFRRGDSPSQLHIELRDRAYLGKRVDDQNFVPSAPQLANQPQGFVIEESREEIDNGICRDLGRAYSRARRTDGGRQGECVEETVEVVSPGARSQQPSARGQVGQAHTVTRIYEAPRNGSSRMSGQVEGGGFVNAQGHGAPPGMQVRADFVAGIDNKDGDRLACGVGSFHPHGVFLRLAGSHPPVDSSAGIGWKHGMDVPQLESFP